MPCSHLSTPPSSEEKFAQLCISPYEGAVDLSKLPHGSRRDIDLVSFADILRNAFVCPPYSIYSDLRLQTLGLSSQTLHSEPHFEFPFREHPPLPSIELGQITPESDLADLYHTHLCQAASRTTLGMKAPWMFQSGGKDSTSLAIALAEARPNTVCLTYLGGREEDEVSSAESVAQHLGLKHEVLVCDPGRAYDNYLDLIPRMPLLTADFATLSYADMVTFVSRAGGDGIIDGLGSDVYLGTPISRALRAILYLARGISLPPKIFSSPLLSRSFRLSYALSTLQMSSFERFFPGTRFSDSEVDAMFEASISNHSRQRLTPFLRDASRSPTVEERRAISVALAESAGAFAKGLYTSHAMGMPTAYPFCDSELVRWVREQVPLAYRMDQDTATSKIIVRQHIAKHFNRLNYVDNKGSFRFDLVGLAAVRFDQVLQFAEQSRAFFPGGAKWLKSNQKHMSNKAFASKFYLLAVSLPWILDRMQRHATQPNESPRKI